MVQLLDGTSHLFMFHVGMDCEQGGCGVNSTMLIAVVGIPVENPIPGGCTLTSSLYIDPNIALTYTPYSTTVRFQDADTGFKPALEPYPTCDVARNSSKYPLQNLDYTVYQRCLGRGDFSVSHVLSALERMLTVEESERQEKSYVNLVYNNIKSVEFSSAKGQGVVYNVIATDKRTGLKSAYVPMATYACDLHSNGSNPCQGDVPVINGLFGVLLALAGLFLCFVGHNFFHGEVAVLHTVGGTFLCFMFLSIVTSWDNSMLVGISVVLACLYSMLWFLVWALTGWYWMQVIAFGMYSGFILSASLFYAPLEYISVFTVLQISYVYILSVVCAMILFVVPLVSFPRALNIWSSSLVGSYSIVFSVGMFTYTELSEIVLLVVRKFSITGFYQAHLDCPLQFLDYILISVWLLLLITGLSLQTIIVQVRKHKFKQRQKLLPLINQRRFNSFPHPSLLLRLRLRLRRRGRRICAEEEPLLSPSSRLPSDSSVGGSVGVLVHQGH